MSMMISMTQVLAFKEVITTLSIMQFKDEPNPQKAYSDTVDIIYHEYFVKPILMDDSNTHANPDNGGDYG